MKIIRLQSENIKKLKAIDISPDQKNNIVKVYGDNGAGKSSVLDSIVYALGGGKSFPKEPIRQGEEKGSIKIELDNGFKIERTFTSKGSYLKVTSDDKGKYGQAKLSEWIKCFDPSEFIQLDAKAQKVMLSDLLGITKNLEDLREKRQAVYQERVIIGRQRDQVKGVLDTCINTEKVDKIDIVMVSEELNKLKDQGRKILESKAEISNSNNEIKRIKEDIADLEDQVRQLEDVIEEKNSDLKLLNDSYSDDKIKKLEEKLSLATAQNNKAEEYQKYIEAKQKFTGYDLNYKNQTSMIHSVEVEAEKIIKSAKMPIEGLGFTGEGLVYNGILFDQLSAGEQLRVAIAIAFAMNPELRVVLVKDGAIIDDKNYKILQELAQKYDFQVWYEDISARGSAGFLIEEGEVKK